MKAYVILWSLMLCISAHAIDFDYSGHLKGGKSGGLVGNIPMEIGVDNTGAATFSIPIDLPPGCGGLTPELSINYNSIGDNGMFGRGVELSGVSAIYRTAATRFVNGYDRGVMFDSDDALCLDGQPIIRNESNPLKYHCRIGDVYDIVADDYDNPTRFTLRDGNGITKEFGLTENSRIYGSKTQTSSRTMVFAWLLERVTDSFGNYYTITYTDINHPSKGVAIDKIEYSGNENMGITPQVKVLFRDYISDKGETTYHGNNAYWKKYSPRFILVYVGAQQVKEYKFSYESSTDYTSSFLKSVTLEGSNWQSVYNPIEFTWQHPESKIKAPVRNTISGIESSGVYVGDYNGDGLPDILVTPNDNTAWKNFKYYINDGNGGFILKKEFDVTLRGGSIFPTRINKLVETYVADFNGDGRDDVMFEGHVDGQKRRMEIYLSDGNGFYDSGIDIDFTDDNARIIGDFNGDGAADIMFAVPGTTTANFYLSQLSENKISPMELAFETSVSEPWEEIHPGNFDGGHNTDIINLQQSSHICYSINEEKRTLDFLHRGGFPNRSETHYLGDFNGDGKTDVVMTTYNGNKYLMREAPVMCLCTGTQFITQNMDRYGTSVFRYDRKILVSDINGDGRDDFISIPNSNSQSTGSILTLFSSGNGVNYVQDMYLSSNISFADRCYYSMQDIYGEGKHTLFGLPHSDSRISGEYLIYSEKTPCENVITEISDCMGNITKFQYERWTDYTNSPFIEVWDDYPYSGCSMPLPLVKKMSQSNGRDDILNTVYEYKNARTHLGKMGFLGFKNVVTTKPEEKMMREDSYMLDPNFGMLNVLGITKTMDGQRIHMEKNIYDTKLSPSGTIMLHNMANTNHSYSPENSSNYLTVNTGWTYDKWGNVLTESVTTNDSYRQVTTNKYDLKETRFWIHRPLEREVEKTVVLGDSHVEKEVYEYRNGLSELLAPTQISSYLDRNEMRREQFVYDTFGNCCTKIVGGINSSNNVKTVQRVYSMDGRLCEEEYLPMDYTKSYSYDKVGNLVKVTASDGLVDSIKYDDFGNVVSVEKLGVTTIQGIVWSNGMALNPKYGVYCKYNKKGTDTYNLEFYDSSGKLLRKCYDMMDKTVAVDYDYDNLGHVVAESLPYYIDSDDKRLTQYAYDDFGNVITIIQPNGYRQTKEYDYSIDGVAVTTISDNGQTTQMNDHFNRLLWSENELGQRVVYDYDALGRCTSADVNGLKTSFDYFERYGYQYKEIDNPDFGSINYEYNELNNLTKRSNSIQNSSFEYNKAGNLTSKNNSSMAGCIVLNNTYNYKYLLSSPQCVQSIENNTNGYLKTYDYDNYKRVIKHTETIDGSQYSISADYNDDNRIKSLTYPNGLRLLYEYDGDIVVSIKNDSDGSVIWKADNITAFGKPVSCVYGDSIEVAYTYDYATERLLGIKCGSLVDIQYTINDRGLIESREENHMISHYSYDALGRLSSVGYLHVSVQPEKPLPDLGIRDSLSHLNPLSSSTNGVLIPSDRPIYLRDKIYYKYDDLGNIVSIVYGDSLGIRYKDCSTRVYSNELKGNPIRWNRLEMNSANRIRTISNDTCSLYMDYGPDDVRILSRFMSNNSQITRRYVSSDYEVIDADGEEIQLCYISANGKLVAIYAQGEMYYVIVDHQGSIMCIIDGNKNVVASYSYAEWGQRYSGSLKSDEHPWIKYFNRGYCGHEHLPEFALINMGARIYDPVDMRFLSPDPYVQNPTLPQNFNRYSYCLNNPINYTDPDGEFFIIDDFFVGLIHGLFKGYGFNRAFNEGVKRASNSIKIWHGLVKTGYKQGFFNRALELFSRFTWQLPQTIVGWGYAEFSNTIGKVESVGYYGGATVISSTWDNPDSNKAVTLGNYIVGSRKIDADPRNEVFQHEYGHYIQSMMHGPAYLFTIGIPSLLNTMGWIGGEHKYFWTERDANNRAFKYFRQTVADFQYRDWIMESHPTYEYRKNPNDPKLDSRERTSMYGNNNANITHLVNSLNIR